MRLLVIPIFFLKNLSQQNKLGHFFDICFLSLKTVLNDSMILRYYVDNQDNISIFQYRLIPFNIISVLTLSEQSLI